jgi:peptidylprolyl isomerase
MTNILARHGHLLVAALSAAVIAGPVAAQTAIAPPAAATPRPAAPAAAPKPKTLAAASPMAPLPATTSVTPAATGKASADAIARVGNSDLSADELRGYISALSPRDQSALAKDPALLSQTVRALLANRLVLQELTEKKWDQQPAIAAQLEKVRENAVVDLYLRSVSTPPASFPSDDEVQKVYDANRASMMVPRQYELQQIFIALPQEADKPAEEKARKLLADTQAKLKAPGADFLTIAGSESGNGELGWLPENQIRPEIRAQVTGLSKGGIAEPIRLEDGWHLLRLKDTKAAYLRTLPEVHEQLVEQMRNERANQLRQAYVAEVQRQRPAVINEMALSSLLSKSAQ